MTRDEFLTEMQDVLQTEETLSFETVLEELDEWDSLAVMATMAFLDKNFGVKTSISDYLDIKTLEDIAVKAGLQHDFLCSRAALHRDGGIFGHRQGRCPVAQ